MRPFRHLLLLCLVLLSNIPQASKAIDYFEESYTSMCFTATPNGPGCVHFKIMYLDQTTGANGYIEWNVDHLNGAWLYMTEDGSNDKRYILSLYCYNDRDDDDDDWSDVKMKFSHYGENASKYSSNGKLLLTNSYDGTPFVELLPYSWQYQVKKADGRCPLLR